MAFSSLLADGPVVTSRSPQPWWAGRPATRTPFLPEEDALIIELKEGKKLRWDVLEDEFARRFRHRSESSLQVRYSTKLKQSANWI